MLYPKQLSIHFLCSLDHLFEFGAQHQVFFAHHYLHCVSKILHGRRQPHCGGHVERPAPRLPQRRVQLVRRLQKGDGSLLPVGNLINVLLICRSFFSCDGSSLLLLLARESEFCKYSSINLGSLSLLSATASASGVSSSTRSPTLLPTASDSSCASAVITITSSAPRRDAPRSETKRNENTSLAKAHDRMRGKLYCSVV